MLNAATPPVAAKPAVHFRRPRSFQIWLACVPIAKAAGIALFFSGYPQLAPWFFFSPAPWLVWQFLVPTSHGFGPAVRRFRTSQKEVWLTIDDGPDPVTTPVVLDLLEAHHARATFFVVGEKVARHPELVAEIVRRGHTLGNHTHTHPQIDYWNAGVRRTGAEMDRCTAAILATGASASRWFRPPVGLKSLALHRALAARDLDLVLWSARGYDTKVSDPDSAVRRICRQLAPGAIILAHESGPPGSVRVEVIARLLERLHASGYTCVLPSSEQLIRD